jgi:histidyl-tRNA synthetase
VLVALNDDGSWGAAQDVAAQLRARGIATEVAAKAEKFGKQIKFADRRGIPFVWFTDDDGKHQVKDIRTGEQVDADPATWAPAEEDLHVRVTRA